MNDQLVMKKVFTKVVCLALVLLSCSSTFLSFAAELPNNRTIWYKTTDGKPISPKTPLEIKENELKKDGYYHLVFKESLNGINAQMFSGLTTLSCVILPKKVVNIGDEAFFGCNHLSTLNMQEKVIVIGEKAFMNCIELSTIQLSASLQQLGPYSFSGCSSLKSIIIPSGVKDIEPGTFEGCKLLKSVTYEARDLHQIGKRAFFDTGVDCSAIPDSVKVIGDYAYSNTVNCSGELKLPETLEQLGEGAFSGSSILSVEFSKPLPKIGPKAFMGCSSLVAASLPTTMSQIPEAMFYRCSHLLSIALPDALSSISSDAFNGCKSLSEVVFPTHLVEIGEKAFYDSGIKRLELPDSITMLGNEAFGKCPLEEVKLKYELWPAISSEVKKTKVYIQVYIPDGVQTIPADSFADCFGLVEITLPPSVLSIGDGAFLRCSGLKSVNLSEGLVSIGKSAFSETGFKEINLPGTLKRIDDAAFSACALEALTIPDSVKEIGSYAFRECVSLKTVVLPKSISIIEDHLFDNCERLQSVTIPAGVTEIGMSAFNACSSLKELILPSTLKTIGLAAFYSCINLQSLNLPSSLVSMGEEAFHATGLETISIPAGMKSLPMSAFADCSHLRIVSLPSTLMEIGPFAFAQCSSLETISLPEELVMIGDGAFAGCKGLKSVLMNTKLNTIGSRAFEDCSALVSIKLPEGLLQVGGEAFSGCTELASISIPLSLTRIPDKLLYNCVALKNLNLPKDLVFIGEEAFSGTSINSLRVPSNVSTIRHDAFGKMGNGSATTTISIPYALKYEDFDDWFTSSQETGKINVRPVETVADKELLAAEKDEQKRIAQEKSTEQKRMTMMVSSVSDHYTSGKQIVSGEPNGQSTSNLTVETLTNNWYLKYESGFFCIKGERNLFLSSADGAAIILKDVDQYYHLKERYNTPLKLSTFKKSNDYQIKIQELEKSNYRAMNNISYYLYYLYRPAYDMTSRCFYFEVNSSSPNFIDFGPVSISFPSSSLVRRGSKTYFKTPTISEETALQIEESSTPRILFIYKFTNARIVNDGPYNTVGHVQGKTLGVYIVEEKTGKVFVDLSNIL